MEHFKWHIPACNLLTERKAASIVHPPSPCSWRRLRMQCSHRSGPLLSLHAVLVEDRHSGGAQTSVHKEPSSMFPKTCQPHPLLPADTFLGCLSQEVWPSTSVLSLVMNCIWTMSAPPSSYLPMQLESLYPVFLHFFVSAPHQRSFL